MKKKVKLFTTIASLCLAVALMAFGVYAALNVNYTIKNTVSYSAAANVKATVTYTTTLTNATATIGTAEGEAYTPVTDKQIWSDTIGSATDVTAGEEVIGDLVLKPIALGQDMVFTYTVKIQNNALASDAYKVLNVDLSLKETLDNYATQGYKITVTGADGTVAQGAEAMTYSVSITVSSTASIQGIDLGSSFALTMITAA